MIRNESSHMLKKKNKWKWHFICAYLDVNMLTPSLLPCAKCLTFMLGGYRVSYNGIMCIVPFLKPIYLRFALKKKKMLLPISYNKAHKRNKYVCSYKMEISTKYQWLLIVLITSRLYTHSHFSLLKSLLRWNIVLIAVVPFQLTMILTQESFTSYLNTPSQRLTELSKYKAGLSEDESQKETVFWLWGWKENESCITYVVSKEAFIMRYLVFY